MFRKIAKYVAGLVLAANLSSCATIEVKSGYNALETAVTSEENIRNRVLINKDLIAENVSVGYHALAELDNLDPSTHFGSHGFTVGMGDVQGICVLKTGGDGITDSKCGVRLRNFSKLGGYGSADITTDHNSSDLSVFYGKQLGRFSIELYEAAKFPFDGSPTSYTEFQVNGSVGNNLSVFGRAETTEFEPENTRYLFGLTINF